MTCPAVLTALLVLGIALPPRTPQAGPNELLLQYAGGDDAGLRRLSGLNVAALQRELERLVKARPSLKSQDQEISRRALAALGLAALRAHVLNDPSSSDRVLVWLRETLIAPVTPPGEFERRWHLTAVAVLEGLADDAALERELALALAQFPSEPSLLLASAVAAEPDEAKMSDAQFVEASRRYQRASESAPVRGEALLRLGYLEFRMGRLESAVARLHDVESLVAGDPSLLYLSRLFQGRACVALGRWDDADQHFRGALDAVPAAQSATLGLAMALFQRGSRDEASALASQIVGQAKPADDPWWTYRQADYRFFEQRATSMREAVK